MSGQERREQAGWSIWLVDRDGSAATELGEGEEPVFSPAELEGARLVQLTNYLGDATQLEFTPNGRYLHFASQRNSDVHHIWMGEIAQ